MFLVEISEGSLILRSKISENHLITGAPLYSEKGILVLSRSGDIIRISITE